MATIEFITDKCATPACTGRPAVIVYHNNGVTKGRYCNKCGPPVARRLQKEEDAADRAETAASR